MGQGDSGSVLPQAKVWKMREYFVCFPFFILHDWGKRSAEARSSHLSGVAFGLKPRKRAAMQLPQQDYHITEYTHSQQETGEEVVISPRCMNFPQQLW